MFLSSVACQNSIGTTWKHGVLGSIKKVRISTCFPTLLLTASDENVLFFLLHYFLMQKTNFDTLLTFDSETGL